MDGGHTVLNDLGLQIEDITFAHYQEAVGGYKWDDYKNGRNIWGICYSVSGESVFRYKNGSEVRMAEGEVAFIPSSACYQFVVPRNVSMCCHYTVNFSVKDNIVRGFTGSEAYIVKPVNTEDIGVRFRAIMQLWDDMKPGYKLLALSELYRINYDILKTRMKSAVPSYSYKLIKPAFEYIRTHYYERVTVKKLSEMCDISPMHLNRLFQSVYNVSPITCLINIRIEKAKSMLQIAEYSIDNISEMLGFNNTSYFIRTFKAHVGTTPHKFRQGE